MFLSLNMNSFEVYGQIIGFTKTKKQIYRNLITLLYRKTILNYFRVQMVQDASSLKSRSSKVKNPNASLQSLHPKESYRQNFDNTAAPLLFPSIMQRRHPECSADSCTLSASIAKRSHQTRDPGRLPHCNFAAILSVM